ncbi:MAG TPA: hypothetical protein VFU03_08070, partial [Gemmatimonadales bacterium]|nr:hypothetical protein [Gemmatimonadales bacterium]
MKRSAIRAGLIFSSTAAVLACTGLMAGPVQPDSKTALTGVAPDSAYKRARSQLGTEVFSIVEENVGERWIKATRYPSPTAKANTAAACRLMLTVHIEDSEVKTTGQWAASQELTTEAGRTTCDQELA